MAIRSDGNTHLHCDNLLRHSSQQLQLFIKELSDLVKNKIQKLFPRQFTEVESMLKNAYEKAECNSLLLLSRNKQTIHSFLNQIEINISDFESTHQLRVVRVNSILNNSENKIFVKFCEALKVDNVTKNYTIEMIEHVKEFFV